MQLTMPNEAMLANAAANLKRDLPMFLPHDEGEELCIVGGGPSLPSILPNLRMKYQRGAKIWALNGAHDWLLDHHLMPNAMVLLDARPEMAQFVARASRIPRDTSRVRDSWASRRVGAWWSKTPRPASVPPATRMPGIPSQLFCHSASCTE